MFNRAALLALLALTACKVEHGLTPCANSSVCTLVAGGQCLPSPEGIDLCAYPAAECASGLSWSPQAGNLAGECVTDDDADAANNSDGGTDARPDGPTPPAQWARAFGGADTDLILDIASTPDDGIVLVGQFRNSISFGGSTLEATPGHFDAFVAKLSAGGQHIWSKRLGGVGYDGAQAVTVDAAGDVYVAGICQGSADFDGQTLAICGEFLLKLTGSSGSRVWVQRIGPTVLPAQLAVAENGSAIYFASQFSGTINLGGQPLTSSADSNDIALAKYDGAGAHAWSVRAGGAGAEEPLGIALMPNEDVLVVGRYQGQADFGTGAPLQEIGAVGQDAFIARFAATNGAGIWARGFGSTSSLPTFFTSVVADSTGAYVGGSFYGTASFGGTMQVVSGTDSDGIIAKYETTNGTHLWSTRIGSNKADSVQRVRVSGNELWLAGNFLDATMVGSHPLLSGGGTDVMYGKVDTSTGVINGAANLGGVGGETDAHLTLSANHLTIAGPYSTAFTLLGIPLPSAMGTDIFVARIIR